jgi:hypothetical protein
MVVSLRLPVYASEFDQMASGCSSDVFDVSSRVASEE